MKITSWGATDVGKKRENNEDNFLIDKDMMLFIVADGMGGHESGEEASRTAVAVIHEQMSKRESIIRQLYEEGERSDLDEIAEYIKKARIGKLTLEHIDKYEKEIKAARIKTDRIAPILLPYYTPDDFDESTWIILAFLFTIRIELNTDLVLITFAGIDRCPADLAFHN